MSMGGNKCSWIKVADFWHMWISSPPHPPPPPPPLWSYLLRYSGVGYCPVGKNIGYRWRSLSNLKKKQIAGAGETTLGARPPPPPHSVLFRGTHMLVPSLWKHPPILRTDKYSEPPFRGLFAGFSCLKDPPKSRTLLNVPPVFYLITPFLNFSGVQREIERERKKNHPFLKEISGWKVKYPPFLQFSGQTLSHEKYPFTGDFGNTHAVPPDPRVGGGGGGRGLASTFLLV